MRNLKSALTGAIMLFVCFAANATAKFNTDKPTKSDVVNLYIAAVANGRTAALKDILDDGLQFNILRGQVANTVNKKQVIEFLTNSSAATDAAPTTNTTVMQEDDSQSVVKVEFKYAEYTRTDIVTLQKANGWMITKVDSSYNQQAS